MCAQVTQYRRKRASVSSALTAIQPVKERKKSKGGPDLAAANRKLQAMSDQTADSCLTSMAGRINSREQ